MLRRTVAVLAVLLLVAVVAAAQEPWKSKTFANWDEKDLVKILNESPWVKKVTVRANWQRQPGKAGDPGQAGIGASGGGGGNADNKSPFGDALPPEVRAAFFIRWSSAKVIREGFARAEVVRGTIPQAEAEKLVGEAPADFIVVMQGADMTPFLKSTEEGLSRDTYIQLKSNKQRLSPSSVEIRRSQDGKRVIAVAFHFTRQGSAGEPTIAPSEKGVNFVSMISGSKVEASFDVQKMTTSTGVDL